MHDQGAAQPPTEKVHQIIARTALFVSRNGGQSEIVLRVKQGDNPMFGFLMPDHDLHAYFRFLVDHPELLHSDSELKAQDEGRKASNELKERDGVGGALSLLGSVYGSGEDEEHPNGDVPVSKSTSEACDALNTTNISCRLERAESSSKICENDEKVTTHSLTSSGKDKEKTPALKKNSLFNTSKSRSRSGMSKEDAIGSSVASASEKTKAEVFALGETSKAGRLVDPPSDLKRLIDKIVDFILKNGKQFESTLIEQDSKHGRFPFLLPSNQYHPYYINVLQKAQESKKVHGPEERALSCKENDSPSLGSMEYDLPYAFDKKEKFKMVISKSKKDPQETSTRSSQQEVGVSVDAAAAAAILQAATRGIKKPNLSIISGSSRNGDSGGHSGEGAQPTSSLNVPPSGLSNLSQKSGMRMEHNVLIPKVKEIAKSAAAEAANEADSSEAHLSKEQKLKAERLRRAKMFVALLKTGAAPVKRDSSHRSSVEPQESALSGSGTKVIVATKEKVGSAAPSELTAVEREGSLAPLSNMVSENEITEVKNTTEEHERRSRRKYRSRADRHDEEDEEEEEEEEADEEEQKHSRKKHRSSREEEGGDGRDEKRSKRKRHRRSHRHIHKGGSNPDEDEDEDNRRSRKKHSRQHSSPEYDDNELTDEERCHKHGKRKHSSHRSSRKNRKDDDEGDYLHSKKKHRSRRTFHRSRDKHERRSKHSDDDESGREHKHVSSSNDEEQHCGKTDGQNAKDIREKEELEEGEIRSKVSDQSRGSVSREASVDVFTSQHKSPSQPPESAQIPDDLRAKIREMLMATRK